METEDSPDIQVEADRNLSNSRVAAAASDGLSEDVMAAEFPERARIMFLNGDGAPHLSGKPCVIENPDDITFGHLKAAKVAVGDINVASNPNVNLSWGEMLDEMEAFAYLVGDPMRRMLVDTEARSLGRELERQLKGARERSEKLRGNAAARRSKARKAAEKDETKAAALDERLRAIDDELDGARRDLWAEKVKKVNWPSAQSVVVDGPAPVHWRARDADSDDDMPRTAVEAAEAATEAEADAQAAEAMAEAMAMKAERAAKSLARLPGAERCEVEWVSYLVGAGEKKRPSDEEMKRRDAGYDRVRAAEHKLRVAVAEAEAAESSASYARRAADLQAKLACTMEVAEAACERERAEALAQELQARLDESVERMAAIELEAAGYRQQERDLVRGSVLMDAQKVWGSVDGTAASAVPKVFSLVGKSADSVRALAGEVSQEVTGNEERAALKRLGCPHLSV
jgi:hypothetical protein